jgi:hypothetical protein
MHQRYSRVLLLLPSLRTGWNAIGFPGTARLPAAEMLKPVEDKWGQIIGFDPADQTYDTAILNGGREPFNDDRMPYPYSGYWLFMRENGTIAAITP